MIAMRTDLNVPFAEKDDAKALGARWDPAAKIWYVPDGMSTEPFTKWLLDEDELEDGAYIYLVFAKRECWSCGEQTEVVGFGIPYQSCASEGEADDDGNENEEGFVGYCQGDTSEADSLTIVNPIGCVPAEIRTYIEKRCGYRKMFSKTVGDFQMANTCTHCGKLQGNFMLFSEVGSPFFVQTPEDLEKLTFTKVDVAEVYGAITSASIYIDAYAISNMDAYAFAYAKAHHEDFPERLIEDIYL